MNTQTLAKRMCSVMLALSLPACATVPAPASKELAHAEIMAASGERAGRATLTAKGDQVSLTVQVKQLAAGLHGIHLHTTGKCEGPAFTSAGGHLNPAMHQHGTMNPQGPHMGDLPNLSIAPDGAGVATVVLPDAIADIESAIFDADGTAIVVHAGTDDYKTDPSGNSGGRIACGVFIRN